MPSEITTPLRILLEQYRAAAKTNREAGTYFEELTVAFLRTEPAFKELYATVASRTPSGRRAGASTSATPGRQSARRLRVGA